jgi:hypothetical protein
MGSINVRFTRLFVDNKCVLGSIRNFKCWFAFLEKCDECIDVEIGLLEHWEPSLNRASLNVPPINELTAFATSALVIEVLRLYIE